MKKLLLSGVAAAAMTVAVSGPASATPLPYSWTGCYVGVNGGGAWMRTEFGPNTQIPNSADADATGFAGGGQVGCDFRPACGYSVRRDSSTARR